MQPKTIFYSDKIGTVRRRWCSMMRGIKKLISVPPVPTTILIPLLCCILPVPYEREDALLLGRGSTMFCCVLLDSIMSPTGSKFVSPPTPLI